MYCKMQSRPSVLGRRIDIRNETFLEIEFKDVGVPLKSGEMQGVAFFKGRDTAGLVNLTSPRGSVIAREGCGRYPFPSLSPFLVPSNTNRSSPCHSAVRPTL